MRGVIYARYSSDNQREESIEGQIRECTAFAEKNGIFYAYYNGKEDMKPLGSANAPEKKPEPKPKGKSKKHDVPKSIPTPPSQIEQVKEVRPDKRETFRFSLSRDMYSQNGVLFVYASEGETYASIAESNNLFLRELLRFNELQEDVTLKPGTVVYLQKKKKSAAEGLEMHVIEKGETLRAISQRYGVRLDRLCKINGIEDRNVIREGDIIRLR